MGKKSLRQDMARFLPASYSKVLEVGCNEGDFSLNLRSNCELWGIEPNSAFAGSAEAKGYRVLIGKYEDTYSDLPDDYFDLVICNDVIEHMTDHDLFFSSITTKMRMDGILIASIPNVRHISNLFELLVKKDWPYRSNGILDRTHLRFFTKKSLYRTLCLHGFHIDTLKGINSCIAKYAFSGKLFDILITLVTSMVVILTLGYYADVQYLQYAVSVRKTAPTD